METSISAKTSLMKLVNRLIRESFGNSFRGDLNFTEHTSGELLTGEVKLYFETSKLGFVAKKGLYLPSITSPNYHLVGKFMNEIGDDLEIFPNYLKQARQYACLYDAATHRDVKIRVFDDIVLKKDDQVLSSLKDSRFKCKVLNL